MFESDDGGPSHGACDMGRTRIDRHDESRALEDRRPLVKRQPAQQSRGIAGGFERRRNVLAFARAGDHDGRVRCEPANDGQCGRQRASVAKPALPEMDDDRVGRQRPRDLAVGLGDVEAQPFDAPRRARQRDQVEQLHDLVADDSIRPAFAELRDRPRRSSGG